MHRSEIFPLMSVHGHNLRKGCTRLESAFHSDSSHKANTVALTLCANKKLMHCNKCFEHVEGERLKRRAVSRCDRRWS